MKFAVVLGLVLSTSHLLFDEKIFSVGCFFHLPFLGRREGQGLTVSSDLGVGFCRTL